MPSDLIWFVVVLFGSIAALPFVRLVARRRARAQPAHAVKRPVAASASRGPAAGPPAPQEVVLASALPSVTSLAAVPDRRTPRLNLADARKGIVLGTIVGPCWAHSPDADYRPDGPIVRGNRPTATHAMKGGNDGKLDPADAR